MPRRGDREDMVEILVDPLLMESYGLEQADIYNLVERNNRLVPAGTMDTGKGRFAIKVPSVFENIQDLQRPEAPDFGHAQNFVGINMFCEIPTLLYTSSVC